MNDVNTNLDALLPAPQSENSVACDAPGEIEIADELSQDLRTRIPDGFHVLFRAPALGAHDREARNRCIRHFLDCYHPKRFDGIGWIRIRDAVDADEESRCLRGLRTGIVEVALADAARAGGVEPTDTLAPNLMTAEIIAWRKARGEADVSAAPSPDQRSANAGVKQPPTAGQGRRQPKPVDIARAFVERIDMQERVAGLLDIAEMRRRRTLEDLDAHFRIRAGDALLGADVIDGDAGTPADPKAA